MILPETYEYSSQVDGTTYSVRLLSLENKKDKRDSDCQPAVIQLEILDTAGLDQFHTLNEKYIKVSFATRDHLACKRAHLNILQSAHGFMLVFRCAFPSL